MAAAAPEMRPPRCRYSSVSREATQGGCPFSPGRGSRRCRRPTTLQRPGVLREEAFSDSGDPPSTTNTDSLNGAAARCRRFGRCRRCDERDDHGGVAGGHDFLEDVLEHHGVDLGGARQLVGLHEALEELGSGDVDAFGEFLVAEGDGHGDDLDAVVAGVVFLYVRRRINDDDEWPECLPARLFSLYSLFACCCLSNPEERRVNCSASRTVSRLTGRRKSWPLGSVEPSTRSSSS